MNNLNWINCYFVPRSFRCYPIIKKKSKEKKTFKITNRKWG